MILQTFGNTSGPNAPDHTRSRATLRLDKVVFKAAGHVISKHKEVWTPALEKAGIDYRPPLQTRHTFATMVLSAGEDVGWVQNRSDKRFTNLVPMDEYRRKKKSSGILLSP
jgi:integrase